MSADKIPTRVVLGHPYEGAFYWLLSAESWRGVDLKSPYRETDGYYRTLYGSAPQNIVDKVASLCLLYDEVFLAPADIWLPDREQWTKGQRYQNDKLGVVTDWAWQEEHSDLEKKVARVISDPAIRRDLQNVPNSAQRQILRTTIVQNEIRDIFDADLAANKRHKQLAHRIRKLLGKSDAKAIDNSDVAQPALKEAMGLASLHFSLASLDEFAALRTAPQLRAYAKSFHNALDVIPKGTRFQTLLYPAMLKAMNTSQIADKINGSLSLAATLSGAVGLIPIVGTAAGIVGIAADASARAASKIERDRSWWALVPEISSVLTKARLEKKCRLIEREEGLGKGGLC